jgi:hypothetical protein
MPDPNAISEYLGDGVTAQFDPDGNQIWLIVERKEPAVKLAHVLHVERVALDTTVFSALCRFADRCWPEGEPS